MESLIFGRLRKIEETDDGFLRVEGIASTEDVDRAGEIVKASAIKEALPDFFAHGTGALREMHGLVAAGRIDKAEVDEKGRTVIAGTVVDPTAILKVKSGVYRGLSIGGRVLERDKKNRKIITKISLSEISLVDRPANPAAVISLWKANALQRAMISSAMRKAEEVLSRIDDGMRKADGIISTLEAQLASIRARLDEREKPVGLLPDKFSSQLTRVENFEHRVENCGHRVDDFYSRLTRVENFQRRQDEARRLSGACFAEPAHDWRNN